MQSGPERLPRCVTIRQMKTVFVMTGGGSLGAVQVGMLKALLGAGLMPDAVVGVSAGALNGALLARNPSLATVQALEVLWRNTGTRQALGLSWRSALAMLGLGGELGHSRGLRSLLDKALGPLQFSELALPLHVLCAELVTGDAVVLNRGTVIEAVIASAAVPGVFPPVDVAGQQLVDGAVASVSPLTVARGLAAQRIVVLPCGFACAASTVPRHAVGRAMHAITLLGSRQLRQDLQGPQGTSHTHVVPPLCPLNRSPYDYSGPAELIDRAFASTQAWLASGGLKQGDLPGGMPGQLNEHSH